MPLLRSKQAEISILIDSGTSVLTATTLSTIGKTLIAMLNHANECLVSAKVWHGLPDWRNTLIVQF
jgi:hypothetical protein